MERPDLVDLGGSETRKDQRTGPQTSGSLRPASMLGQNFRMSNLCILLLGKSCSGKSATGNTILGKPVFKSKSCGQIVTKTCQREKGSLNKREVVVIDTPDLFSSKFCTEEKKYNIQHCLELSAPTLHVLLLVIRIGHYTREDKETVRGIQDVFGPKAWRYTIIVFTQKDDLGDDLLEDYIDNDKSLKELVQRCGHRYYAFNNKAGEDQRTTQVSELLHKIENLVVKNEGPYHVNFKMEGSRFQNCVNEVVPQEKGHRHGPGEMKKQDTGPEHSLGTSELKVLLVGKHGAGKSTAGNSILGKRVFETKFSECPVTQSFRCGSRIWREKKVLIIDSPDISSSMNVESELRKHICTGPHAFLLVTPLGSYSKKDKAVLETIKRNFGDKFIQYMIILLTRKEDLGDRNLEMFLTQEADLNGLIQQCKNRYNAFNYRVTGREEQRQVDELLQNIENMVQQNGSKPCIFREKEALSIILVGRSGNGKSATGNTILKHDIFLSQLQAQSVTLACQSSRTTWDGQDVVVVDTPFFNQMPGAERDPSWLEEEVKRCWSFCEEGTKTFVLVFQLGRFTEEDKAVVEELEATFGEELMSHAIVLFTRTEDLADGMLENYIENANNKALKNIIKKCKKRYCGFNNKETGLAGESQVNTLLRMANDLRRSHNGKGYPHTWEYVSKQIKHAQEKPSFKNFLKNIKDSLSS
ncbi:GTPase IMAP family member 8 [Nycticebus coucang]|uniref:GTPase IMAP family member 8 n=1 Tax=Nycticebus coucang TaxID=9470 RepID=UPI00234DB01D|nr:GTPase IMAP family member 8 [Nycticebus coucang]